MDLTTALRVHTQHTHTHDISAIQPTSDHVAQPYGFASQPVLPHLIQTHCLKCNGSHHSFASTHTTHTHHISAIQPTSDHVAQPYGFASQPVLPHLIQTHCLKCNESHHSFASYTHDTHTRHLSHTTYFRPCSTTP